MHEGRVLVQVRVMAQVRVREGKGDGIDEGEGYVGEGEDDGTVLYKQKDCSHSARGISVASSNSLQKTCIQADRSITSFA